MLGGVFVSGEWWIELFRPMPASPLREQLLLGSVLFRAALALLGTALVIAPRLPYWRAPAAPVKGRPAPQTRFEIACILGIVACALALRLYKLELGLWYDEVLTYVQYVRLPFGEILTTYRNENQHFVFTLLAHACLQIFGDNVWAFRLPAALFGVGSVWALYVFARQVASTREALFAAALFAFSYHHVWFSQNARGYSGLLFWVLLASWILMRALREDRPGLWVWYAVTVALGVFTHITMLFVVAGHGLVYLQQVWMRRKEQWPRRWSGLVLGFTASGLLTFTLHALVLPQIRGGMEKTVSVVEAWKNPLWTLFEIFRGLRINFAGAAVAAVALIVIAAGIAGFARRQSSLLILLFVPPMVGAGYVIAAGHHLWPRFFYFAFGFAALIAVRGTMVLENALAGRLRRGPVREMGYLCAGMVLVSAASVPFAFAPKQDYEGAMAFVQTERQPGDEVLTAGLISFPYENFYKPGWHPVKSLEQLNVARATYRRTFVLSTLEPVLRSTDPAIADSLKHDFRLVRQFPGTLEHGTIYVYLSEAASQRIKL